MLTVIDPYDRIEQLKQTIRSAQDIILDYIVPDGISQDAAMGKLISLLDNADIVELMYDD